MHINFIEYLGKDISSILKISPFKSWIITQSRHDDLAEIRIHYIFENKAIEIVCDKDNLIGTIFINVDKYDSFKFFEIPFSSNRKKVLKQFGKPFKTQEMFNHSILGVFKKCDYFRQNQLVIAIDYKIKKNEIHNVTLMTNDFLPT